ncbi:vomeronasal 1 receptor cavPorV1R617 [Cavia porcellus]|uniref:vomeronasal 1 receptor cavPorV1R617 n=1 Tax=Cavia porcellus TaxID=10141 RepID=UPI0001CF743E|nr:vomeronasal 1 receptor cavPorV1R617 [Cavia porcellus]
MKPLGLLIGMVFLIQTVTGFLANIVLLFHYLSLYFTAYKLRPTDLIAEHLTIANTLIMLSRGTPQTMQGFGLKYFCQVSRCTLLLYVYRVARSVSVSTTCMLSVFQTIKISPMNSSWKELKAKLPKNIGLLTCFSWILHILINCIFLFYDIIKYTSKNITELKDFGYCSCILRDEIIEILYTAFVLLPEGLCSGLMIWSSGSMIFFLHRHKHCMQYIHKTKDFHKTCPETRATHSIFILVCTFISFYTLSSFFYACIANFRNPSWWLMKTSAFFATCFPTVSPLVLMSCNSTAARLWIKLSGFFRSM